MHVTTCPHCGSKRTTEIKPGTGRPSAIWCHQCGAVSDGGRDQWPLRVEEDDPIYAIWVPNRP